ncbi:MAG: ATP-binding cassette domain-containing protein [Deltaproteobacteria bacterium]|nr:ATP-binding cassette domain-containing protein [Deltaproteobacteria bacterium]MBW1927653.1 ATP-binding cassette domain-containing protein [Deltaproteobacteria bacterium]MBW2026254.1 ATP-binding cassette domain-containing protein [Deltaproteobacteria bacterium]RLB15960.1 MAG: branched-chain amino acid ABC transporter ATP-binding protein [Deltaproteobacteria bacterium]RLB22079.1 MAG: branched-chain amino acid ABC transporter ATP-binding protein [Deltaproteobacteria bacterium]
MPDVILEVSGLVTNYGQVTALKNISFKVFENEIIGIVGPNGSGKTTLLETIAGTLRNKEGVISFLGRRIDGLSVRERRRMGLMLVPQERYIFPMMQVRKNLEVSGVLVSPKRVNHLIDYVYSLFPALKERVTQSAHTLSGGQQKMLAVGIGIVSDARLLLIDEPSIGLAPKLVTRLFSNLSQIRQETGKALFLAEQNVKILRIADRIIGLEGGEIKFVEKSSNLDEKTLQDLYMGQ